VKCYNIVIERISGKKFGIGIKVKEKEPVGFVQIPVGIDMNSW